MVRDIQSEVVGDLYHNNAKGKYIYTALIINYQCSGGALSVMIMIVGKGISNQSSNPGWDCLHFT